MQRFDVVVFGAGTAGSATAWHLARRGLSVAFTDTRAFDAAGARWVNGVPPWMFDEARIPRPAQPELRGADHAFTLLGVSGERYLALDPSPVWSVDMRALVTRLQRGAFDAGATGFDRARLVDLELDGERPVRATIDHGDARVALEAPLFVDATGMRGALRRRVPKLIRDCPAVAPHDICSAAQAVHRVGDPEAAERFLESYQARAGDVLSRLGVSGGYSIGNVCVDGDEVELLTGAIAERSYRAGTAILRALTEEHRWIGRPIFGGAGAIPLRRPYDRLVATGAALVGNAACQVFPAHGSGIGIGMVAARVLAESVADAGDPGAIGALWRYQSSFLRRYGGLLAAYDIFRRMSQALHGREVETLLASGLVNAAGYRAALDQRLPTVGATDVRDVLKGGRTTPSLVSKIAPALARMGPAAALYRAYPRAPKPRALRRWSRTVSKLMGDPPDVRGL